jgi:exopolysaccharide production protein ExoQ
MEQAQRSNILILPFAMLLVCRLYTFGAQVDDSAGDDGVAKMAIEALAYFIAGASVLAMFVEFRPLFIRIFPFFLYALYAAFTAFWSSYPESTLLRVGHMLGLGLVAVCAGMWAQNGKNGLFAFTTGFMLVVLILSLLCVTFFPARGVVNYAASIANGGGARWVGITGHPNLLGAAGIVGIWAALYGLFIEPTRRSRLVSVTTIILSVVALYGSDSRSSLISIIVLGVAFYVFRGIRPVDAQTITKRLLLILVSVGVVLAVVYLINPETTLAPSARAEGADALTARPIIWAYGLDALRERPLGWSYDLLQTYNEAHGRAGLIAHFHNGYLDVAVKGGYIAEILLLMILARMAWILGRLRKIEYALFSVYLPFFAANLIYNLVESGFDRETLLWPMMIVAWLSTEAAVFQREQSRVPGMRSTSQHLAKEART